jgi:hypothetical protein
MCIFQDARMLRHQPLGDRKMKCIPSAALLIIATLLAPGVASQQAKKRPSQEQMKFGLEGSVIQPVPIPDAVLAMLRTDSEVRTSRCVDEGQPSPSVSASWFEASQIHLDGPVEIDLLVKAKDGCLFGANIGPFWIFKKTPHGYALLLAVSALGVEVLPSRTNGHKDVSAGAVAGGKAVSVLYKFDGRRYQESANKVEEIK